MKPKVLFATSINDDYIEGALVMIYSMLLPRYSISIIRRKSIKIKGNMP